MHVREGWIPLFMLFILILLLLNYYGYRRGYSASSQGIMATVARTGTSGARMGKTPGEDAARSTEKVAWVPDPVTGYYRPENRVEEIDVAELRALLLNNKH
ncbi:hypothetical protein F2P56_024874 [Juglans regia]|uniref:Protein SENESCENCE-ASSOCIATED GENE 21, mitochondrial-like n=1 Tax=Juglans regia TaxID=51240 RepID=A0A833UNU9_JUGRE|nr:hypothetical protein F2P56_024874 [Juglans regia]